MGFIMFSLQEESLVIVIDFDIYVLVLNATVKDKGCC